MIGGIGALGVGATLAACGTKGAATPTGGDASSAGAVDGPSATATASDGAVVPAVGPSPAADTSKTDKLVRWANWTLYLDYDETTKTYPTLVNFSKETGIKATYAEDIEDNDSYYGKIQAQLRQGQDMGKDIIVLTDWMAARVIGSGWTQKLDKSVISNGANILDNLKTVGWDNGRNYSYTWQSGYSGIAWNVAELKKLTGKTELKTLDELWDPKLKGRIEVLSEMRDTIGLILLSQGVDPAKPFDKAKWENGLAVLEKQLSSGQIRQVKGNSYKEDMVSKDAVAVIGWSGDILQLNLEARAKDAALKDDPYKFVIPESGGMLWSDNMMVPIGSPHKENAETLINYYYNADVAAEVANYVNYICPVKGAQEAILKIKDVDPAVAKSPFIFPTDADLAKVHQFRDLSTQETTDFTAGFQKVLGV
jgi:spermidine/putrescine transport system substrate-binding protein